MSYSAALTLALPQNIITLPGSNPSGDCSFTINGIAFLRTWTSTATATAALLAADVNASALAPGVKATAVLGVITISNGSTPSVNSITAVSNVTLSGYLCYTSQVFPATLAVTSSSSGDANLTISSVQVNLPGGTSDFNDAGVTMQGQATTKNAVTSFTFPTTFFTGEPAGVLTNFGISLFMSDASVITASTVPVQIDPLMQVGAQ